MFTGAFYSVIPAGGGGTRLWPLSRQTNPKFLHALTGSSASMLQATAARLAPLSTPAQMYVVTGVGHAAAVARQLPDLPDANLLIEPSPRDSCAAIGLAASLIARHEPDAVMGSFAADHSVLDEQAFVATIRAAIVGALDGKLMTVGITPTHPATAYGYLHCAGSAAAVPPAPVPAPFPAPGKPGPRGRARTQVGGVRPVAEFREKPSRELAETYLASNDYLWNAGMFVWRVSTFLDELGRQQPELRAGLAEIADVWGTPDQDRVLGEVWPKLTKISVDHAVMEGAAAVGLVATVPGDFGWTDVGDFDAVGAVLGEAGSTCLDEAGNVVLVESKEAPILLRDTTDTVVVAQSGRVVATLGLRQVVIVDTPDALLVCARDRAQDIKSLVDELHQLGENRYL